MTPQPDPDGDRADRVDEVILACLKAREAGRLIDVREVIASNPEVAEELRAYFARDEFLGHFFEPMRKAAVDDLPLPEGTRVGDYELGKEIDRGGMGIVYEALRVSLNCHVALKMIRNRRRASPEEMERFRTEAQNVANLNHPHIVPILEVGEYQGQPYFSMWLMEGGNLTRLPPRVAGNPRALARLLATVARAVHYAHQRGILHCDLKPANILLDKDGRPHVSDFGLARRAEEGSAERPALLGGGFTCAATTKGGTPGYMAPEQAAGEKVLSTAVDVYGLGTILYELLTGRPPFPHGKVLESLQEFKQEAPARTEFTRRLEDGREKIFRQVREEAPVPPRKVKPRVNRDLEAICLKCLEKEPGKRYGSAEAVAEDLERFADGRPIAARRVGRWERSVKWARRQPVTATLLALVMILAGAGLGAVFYGQWQTDRALEKAENRLYVGSISLAVNFLAAGQYDRAEEALDVCPDGLRNWEWRYLKRLCWNQRSQTIFLRGHPGAVKDVRYSPDGRRIVTAGQDGCVRVWDPAKGGEPLLTVMAHRGEVRNACFSGDGERLITAGEHDQAVKIWDAVTGRELKSIPDGGNLVAASRQGHRFACVGHKKVITVRDDRSGDLLYTLLPAQQKKVLCVALSPDGRYLAASGYNGLFRLWELPPERGPVQDVRLEAPESDLLTNVWAVAFSNSGRYLAVGSARLGLWDVRTRQFKHSLSGLGDLVCSSLSFSRDDQRIAGTDAQGLVRVWETLESKTLLVDGKAVGIVGAVAFSPVANRVLAVAREGQVTIKNIEPPPPPDPKELRYANIVPTLAAELPHDQIVPTLAASTLTLLGSPSGQGPLLAASRLFPGSGPGNSPAVWAPVFSPDGRRLAWRSGDRDVVLWDVATWRPTHTLRLPAPAIDRSNLAFSRDGKWLLSGCRGGGLVVWDAVTGRPGTGPRVPAKDVRCLAFTRDNKRLATSTGDRITVWDWPGGREVRSWNTSAREVFSLAFSPDGRQLASCGQDETLTVWDAQTGKEVSNGRTHAHKRSATGVAFDPAGKGLATCSADLTVKVWDAGDNTRKRPLNLTGHSGYIFGLAYSPDGKRLATCSQDGTVRVWDAGTGQELLTLTGHGNRPVAGVAFSPDGNLLATCGQDGTVRVWDGRPLP